MAWIQTVDEANATGIVKAEYDAALERAGQLYNIVKLFSSIYRHANGFRSPSRLRLHRRGTLRYCRGRRVFLLRQSDSGRIWH